MRHHYKHVLWFVSLLCVASQPAGHAAEVLNHLPSDALGFAVVRDIGATDRKLEHLVTALKLGALAPLEFLRTATGISDGLDLHGEFMLAILPSEDSRQFEFFVWLPVSDYDRLLASLGSKPADGISAVTIAGEDLLIARRDRWAVVMDPDQRDRLEQLLASEPPAQEMVSDWQAWVDANDMVAVAFQGGVQKIVEFVAADDLAGAPADSSKLGDDLFGPAGSRRYTLPDESGLSGASGILTRLRRAVSAFQAAVPELRKSSGKLRSVGIGLRLDDDQNALTRVRVSWDPDASTAPLAAGAEAASDLAPALFHEGGFIVHGAASVPPHVFAAVASAYVRRQVGELTAAERIELDRESLVRFYEAVEQAAAEATSACVLTRPGEKSDGVYTNSFLAVRTANVDKFVDLANEAMRLWNQMNREGQGGPRLVFDVEALSIGDRAGFHYSLDLAQADGAAVLPDARQAMEKLFGPGGKLRLLVAKADEHTALLAGATPEQTAAMLSQLDGKQPLDWQQPPFAVANRLLPKQSDWRAFFSPHGYTTWKSRESTAIVGTDVIGGPLVKEFPASPPLGIAGGMNRGELWLEVAIPAETIRSAGAYLQPRQGGQ